ncbi:MAG: AMP-binding protein [Nitrospiraceae bacterium]|nr:AMP-binding protein [Nitrospiraceae bacterium]
MQSNEKGKTASSRRVCLDKPFIEFEKTQINQSIVERFEQQASRYPSRLAVKTGKAQLTYAGLNQTANRIARDIIERFGPGSVPVALFLDQGIQLISAILAVLKAGKSYVALDTSFPHSKNASVVDHCRPGTILTDRDHYPLASKLFEDTSPLMIIDEANHLYSPSNLNLSISPEATAYIIYTSGSTGEPKGVFQDHRNVLHNVMRCTNMLHIAPDDRLSLLWSCSFAASIPNIFGALLNGAALFPYDIRKNGIMNLADWLIKQEITIYHSVPTAYRHLLSTLAGKENFSRLRMIKLSGEPVRKTDVELYKRHFHEGCIFHVSYASTETNIVRQFFCDHNTEFSGDIVPVGYEVEDMEVMVLDEDGEEAVANCPGEIAVISPYLPPAYYRKDDPADSPFQPDKKGGGRRIYRTGDTGYMLADGCLMHLGRKDQQIKVRGYRVELGEVETALSELAMVKESAVVGYDDPDNGKVLVAYVVLRKDKAATAGELRNALKDRLPDYMVPSRFVLLEAMPLTLSGKIDRMALPDPEREGPQLENAYVAPRTPTEIMLAGIWRKILRIKRVGAADNFFELGGHSLLVARLAAEIRKKTGRTLPIVAILQSPTIKQLAKILQAEGSPSKFPSILIRAGGSRPPFFWVGINTYRPPYLGPEQPVYGIILQGDYGKPIVYRSVEELAAHHLDEIRTVQPKGPYSLGGYCFSGLVAFEMAQQLFRQGEEVSLLCLVEPLTHCLPSCNGASNVSLISRVKSLGAKLALLRSAEKRTSALSFISRTITGNIHFAFCQTCIYLGYPVPRRFRDFYRLHTAGRYVSGAYPGRAAVFLREKRRDADWSGLGAKGTYVHEVIGTVHHTMMDEPYVGIWTRQLNRYLSDIEADEKIDSHDTEMVLS